MPDDLDLESSDDVADEAHAVQGAAGCDQWSGNREKGVPRTHGIDDLSSNRRDRVQRATPFAGDAAVLPLGDDHFPAIDAAVEKSPRHIAEIGQPIGYGEPRLGGVDAHIIGARISVMKL